MVKTHGYTELNSNTKEVPKITKGLGRLWVSVWAWTGKASEALSEYAGGSRCQVAGTGGGELCGCLLEAGLCITAGKALN